MATPAVPTVLKGEPVDWEAFKLLPALLDTLQSIRISEDKDGIQVSKNIKALISRIELCSQILKALPSGDHTDEEKESEINALQEKLKEKWCVFLLFFWSFFWIQFLSSRSLLVVFFDLFSFVSLAEFLLSSFVFSHFFSDMISKYQNLPAMNYENFIKEGPVSL